MSHERGWVAGWQQPAGTSGVPPRQVGMATLAAALRSRRAARMASSASTASAALLVGGEAGSGSRVENHSMPSRRDVQAAQLQLREGLQLHNSEQIAAILHSTERLGDSVREERQELQERLSVLQSVRTSDQAHRVREVQQRAIQRAAARRQELGQAEDALDGLPEAAVADDIASGSVRPEDIRPSDWRPQDVLGRREAYEPPVTSAVVPQALQSPKPHGDWDRPLQTHVVTDDQRLQAVQRDGWIARPYVRGASNPTEESHDGAATMAATLRSRRSARKTAQLANERAQAEEMLRSLDLREKQERLQQLQAEAQKMQKALAEDKAQLAEALALSRKAKPQVDNAEPVVMKRRVDMKKDGVKAVAKTLRKAEQEGARLRMSSRNARTKVDAGQDAEHQARLNVEKHRSRERRRRIEARGGQGDGHLRVPNANEVKHRARMRLATLQRNAATNKDRHLEASKRADAARRDMEAIRFAVGGEYTIEDLQEAKLVVHEREAAVVRLAKRGRSLLAACARQKARLATPKGVDDGDRFSKQSWLAWGEGKKRGGAALAVQQRFARRRPSLQVLARRRREAKKRTERELGLAPAQQAKRVYGGDRLQNRQRHDTLEAHNHESPISTIKADITTSRRQPPSLKPGAGFRAGYHERSQRGHGLVEVISPWDAAVRQDLHSSNLKSIQSKSHGVIGMISRHRLLFLFPLVCLSPAYTHCFCTTETTLDAVTDERREWIDGTDMRALRLQSQRVYEAESKAKDSQGRHIFAPTASMIGPRLSKHRQRIASARPSVKSKPSKTGMRLGGRIAWVKGSIAADRGGQAGGRGGLGLRTPEAVAEHMYWHKQRLRRLHRQKFKMKRYSSIPTSAKSSEALGAETTSSDNSDNDNARPTMIPLDAYSQPCEQHSDKEATVQPAANLSPSHPVVASEQPHNAKKDRQPHSYDSPVPQPGVAIEGYFLPHASGRAGPLSKSQRRLARKHGNAQAFAHDIAQTQPAKAPKCVTARPGWSAPKRVGRSHPRTGFAHQFVDPRSTEAQQAAHEAHVEAARRTGTKAFVKNLDGKAGAAWLLKTNREKWRRQKALSRVRAETRAKRHKDQANAAILKNGTAVGCSKESTSTCIAMKAQQRRAKWAEAEQFLQAHQRRMDTLQDSDEDGDIFDSSSGSDDEAAAIMAKYANKIEWVTDD